MQKLLRKLKMFNTSTQKSQWLFPDMSTITEMRKKANHEFIKKQTANRDYLTYEEEKVLLIHYEYLLKQFCGRFQPPITMANVVGTSITYFKRFYLRNSVMDFHPKDIFLVCVYLACNLDFLKLRLNHFLN